MRIAPKSRATSLSIEGHERPVEITAAKHECVAAGLEPHPAAEVGFQQLAVLDGTGEFQSQGRELSIRAPATDGQNP